MVRGSCAMPECPAYGPRHGGAKGGDINRASSRGRLIIAPTLHVVLSGDYQPVLISLISPLVQENKRVLVLVPDQFILSAVENMLRNFSKESYIIGTRSLVFRSLADIALVVMIDEDNPSYKQEQTPMYETRDVLLMRAKNENINVAFISTAPSVELMYWVENGQVRAEHARPVHGFGHARPVQAIDLNNYKIPSRWFLSPPVVVALESNLTKKINSMVVINHTLGLQQLHKTLQEKFPSAKICIFKRDLQVLKGDIWIGTSALLRFKHQTRAGLVALLDIDGELNRLQMRSCFRAWSLARYFRTMAQNRFLIQTRHPDHYVIKSLTANDDGFFYAEDMRIRQELGLSPFGHQIAIYVRSVQEKLAQKTAQEFYQALKAQLSFPNASIGNLENAISGPPIKTFGGDNLHIHAPVPEVIAKKGRQYRLNILLQGPDVIGMITFIKQARTKIKPSGKVFVTLNVDP